MIPPRIFSPEDAIDPCIAAQLWLQIPFFLLSRARDDFWWSLRTLHLAYDSQPEICCSLYLLPLHLDHHAQQMTCHVVADLGFIDLVGCRLTLVRRRLRDHSVIWREPTFGKVERCPIK
jgi:hypothetical protein